MIIIVVLGILLVILSFTLQFSSEAVFSQNYYAGLKNFEKAYYISASALEGINKIFLTDDPEIDSLKDSWAQIFPLLELKEGKINLLIEDENRYFNPNFILDSSGEIEKKHLEQFKRLLKLIKINPDFSNTVLDYLDKDSNKRIPYGAENFDNQEVPCKNNLFDSIYEFLYLPNFKSSDFYGKIQDESKILGLKNILTVYSNGKININTAPSLILQSLDEEINQNLALEIIKKREEKTFSSLNDLLNIPRVNLNLIYRIKDLADVKSNFYKVKINILFEDDVHSFINILERQGKKIKLILRHAEE